MYVEKGYTRLLLEVERNEEWQFMIDIQALTSFFFLMVILADFLHLQQGFISYPVLKEMCKLKNMCNLPRVVFLEQLLSR